MILDVEAEAAAQQLLEEVCQGEVVFCPIKGNDLYAEYRIGGEGKPDQNDINEAIKRVNDRLLKKGYELKWKNGGFDNKQGWAGDQWEIVPVGKK